MRSAVLVALSLVLVPLGCGKDTTTEGPAKMSACSEVWVDGGKLPEGYEGCKEGSRVVMAELLDCNDHGGQWTRYQQLAGVLGGQIQRLPGKPDTDESHQSSYFFHC